MSEFTFLDAQQCQGLKKLSVFKARGSEAALTDYSILLGGATDGDSHIFSDSSLGGRTGKYWTKTACKDRTYKSFRSRAFYEGENDVYSVGLDGRLLESDAWNRWTGARLVLPLSSLNAIPSNNGNASLKRATDGIIEVEYGYYPQEAASKYEQEIYEAAYKRNALYKTNRIYTTEYNQNEVILVPELMEAMTATAGLSGISGSIYKFGGKEYVRVQVKRRSGDSVTLSNGESYSDGDYVWVKVSPVKWLVDKNAKLMISDKILFAGVHFMGRGTYEEEKFNETPIKHFIDNIFAKELIQAINVNTQTNVNTKGEPTTKIDVEEDEGKHIAGKSIDNPYELDFSDVSEEDIIKGAIQANVAVFLHGKPGCGKSARVKQLDPDFVELNLTHLDPELLDGLAGERDGKAVHIKPEWLEELERKCKEEPDKLHILFLEELTNSTPMMQAKAFGIALDKKVAGRWKLPENVRVVAAGNELEDSLAANEMAEPLYDRFAHVNIETNAGNWLQWAVTPESYYERLDYSKEEGTRPKIHPAVYAYIKSNGDRILRTPYNRERPQPHADPRRWQMASDMLYATNNPRLLGAIIGEKLAREFEFFCKTSTISNEEVLQEMQRKAMKANEGQTKTEKKSNNPYKFSFNEMSAEDIINGAIQANVAVFLHGKPGCGKSARVKQLDPDFIELNLTHLDPELLDGLAGERDGKAVHIKPEWLEELEKKCEEEPDKLHILFLEELTNATPMMQAKAFGIALDKKVAGRWKLPENARVVAAGNELDDSLVANEMAEPLYDRFAHVNIETDAKSWMQWASTSEKSYERVSYEQDIDDGSRPKIHPVIYDYIKKKGMQALRTPYERENPQPHADPRRWEMASDMLYATQNPKSLRGIIGEDLTRDFVRFCQSPRITGKGIIR